MALRQLTAEIMSCFEERKKEIPYKEGKMKNIVAHVGYAVLWGMVTKVTGTGVQMCY